VIARAAVGWQTMLADLSLILFMVTAAAMAEPAAPVAKPAKPAPPPAPPALTALADPVRAQPLSVWREAPGSVGIGPWLASQQIDSRQQLTITVHYPPTGQTRALSDAARLTQEAGARGPTARIVMEPEAAGTPIEVLASLAYDRAAQP
jgi:hypothetical protein